VLHAGFEFEDTVGVHFGSSANRGRSFLGHQPGFGERFRGG
jgi:hypothetical protein